MEKRLLGLFLLISVSVFSVTSATSYYFYVQLANKNNSPYSLSNPSEFLSARAIARRESFNLNCDSTDLPVNPSYITQISNIGINVHSVSKWLNGITVLVPDSTIMSHVRALPFVKWARYTGKIGEASKVKSRAKFESDTLSYGNAATQINQINGTYLHNLGYTGKDILIGVLDAGFLNVNANPGFDSLRLQGRLLGTKNIAEPGLDVFLQDAHGANVLSIMTGNLPSQYLGTAPHASFWLIRTEYGPTEYLVETDFWVSGIEYADSLGVDVVNSSLGYTVFDDSLMNFTYNDLDGTVSRASRAAALAAAKGIIVCNSAGNEGNKTWKYIGSPADADGIVTVGSVTSTGVASVFSSYGPSSDGRVKPEICGMGSSTAFINTSGVSVTGKGTSYSSPVIAGMMACFLQYAKAQLTAYSIPEILQSVFKSGNLYDLPTEQSGYGIPDFQKALANLTMLNAVRNTGYENLKVIYNAENKIIRLILNEMPTESCYVRIYSATGNLLMSEPIETNQLSLPVASLSSGIYLVHVFGNKFSGSQKIMIK